MASAAALLGLGRSLAIYYGQPWKTRALRRFYGAFVAPGDLVFDVGAHVGSRTRVLRGLGATVVALEPQPLFHRFLAATMPRDRVILRAEAVAAEPGRMTLSVSSRHPTVSTLSAGWIDAVKPTEGFAAVRWDGAVEVAVTTLDRLIAEHGRPRFVKIDVEGMEAEILKGLSQPVPMVAVEYLPAALDVAFAALDRLVALGFDRFNRVEGERHAFVGAWRDAAGMREDLRRAGADGRSGDLYAAAGLAGASRGTSATAMPGSAPASTISP